MKIEELACPHGQVFDNRKRWCANCDKTVSERHWKCDDCGAIWPEHLERYIEELRENGSDTSNFGAGYTWH